MISIIALWRGLHLNTMQSNIPNQKPKKSPPGISWQLRQMRRISSPSLQGDQFKFRNIPRALWGPSTKFVHYSQDFPEI